MTTYIWAQLDAGVHSLPGSAVVISPRVLEARAQRPAGRGFTSVTHPRQWAQVQAASNMTADCPDPFDVLVVSARRPVEIDADGLRDLAPGAADAGEVEWHIGSEFAGPSAMAFHDQVHRAGRLLLLTGDLRAYWSASLDRRSPDFGELFPEGAWAAWLPLLVHLYPDGAGTRPAQ